MIYDLAILGGGPAGVAAGVYAARKQLKTVFITHDWLGQSNVSEGVENWIGDIKIPGLELSKKLETHLKAYAGKVVDIHEGHFVKDVQKDPLGFVITTDKGSFKAKTVLVATGSSRRKLDVLGADRLEHKGLTYCASCDGPLFAGKEVVVVGGGNAAFESASQLLAYCKSVTLLNRSGNFKADPVTIEAVSKNPHFNIIKNAIPKEILGDKFVSGIIYTDINSKKDITINASGIFVEIGSIPNTAYLKDIVELNQYGLIPVDPRNQRVTNLSGLWAAGDCTDGLFHQNNIAAGDAVKALEDIYLFLKAK
ncbi:MAG: FAD-dependent oxidoreductase [Patescibacteria group bacterium]|nr:FAD-dependent oxidoreductase [Patescibacteria group bacterium]